MCLESFQPPLPWQKHLEQNRIFRSRYSFETFIEQQHKTRLQTFQGDMEELYLNYIPQKTHNHNKL